MARQSAFSAKCELVAIRERKHDNRARRDDGIRRLNDRDALTADEVREASRERKVHLSDWQRLKHERFIRARLAPGVAELREALVGTITLRSDRRRQRRPAQVA